MRRWFFLLLNVVLVGLATWNVSSDFGRYSAWWLLVDIPVLFILAYALKLRLDREF